MKWIKIIHFNDFSSHVRFIIIIFIVIIPTLQLLKSYYVFIEKLAHDCFILILIDYFDILISKY